MRLLSIYHDAVPDFIEEIARAPEMRRLKQIGMNCGVEYTRFEGYRTCLPYDRYAHSLGVALIVWHFTGDARQAVAGLLHDISTPVFAHTVDFLRGDYLRQEATEARTAEMIDASAAIRKALKRYGLTAEEVSDYHVYRSRTTTRRAFQPTGWNIRWEIFFVSARGTKRAFARATPRCALGSMKRDARS